MNVVWINGTFVAADQAIIKAGDLALHRGYGIFDFFKLIDDAPILWDHYLARFERSAKGLGLNLDYTTDDLKSVIKELLAHNQHPSSGIKLTLTGGYAEDGYTPQHPNLIITQHVPKSLSADRYQQGFKIVTHEYQREFPQLKTINYLRGIYLQSELRENQVDDVLYHQQGLITEFPRSNFFMVDRQGEILTPAHNVLKGITRETVMLLSPRPVREVDVSLDMVSEASELFLTSTLKRILPIVEVNGLPVGSGEPGPVTHQLMEKLDQFQAQKPESLLLFRQ